MKILQLTINQIITVSHLQRQVELIVRISLTLFRHLSLSNTAFGKFSTRHPVSSQMINVVFAGRSILVCLCVAVHRRISLMSSFLLL